MATARKSLSVTSDGARITKVFSSRLAAVLGPAITIKAVLSAAAGDFGASGLASQINGLSSATAWPTAWKINFDVKPERAGGFILTLEKRDAVTNEEVSTSEFGVYAGTAKAAFAAIATELGDAALGAAILAL